MSAVVYLTPRETAELLRRSVKSLYRLIEADASFPRLRLPGGQLLIPRVGLERWLRDHTEGMRHPLPSIDTTRTSATDQRTDAAGALK